MAPDPQSTVIIPCPDESIGRGPNLRGLHEVVLRYASADDAITAMQALEETRYVRNASHD